MLIWWLSSGAYSIYICTYDSVKIIVSISAGIYHEIKSLLFGTYDCSAVHWFHDIVRLGNDENNAYPGYRRKINLSQLKTSFMDEGTASHYLSGRSFGAAIQGLCDSKSPLISFGTTHCTTSKQPSGHFLIAIAPKLKSVFMKSIQCEGPSMVS